MHDWGDEDVDWAGISQAAEYLGNFCAKWGRFTGQTKEKYGTVRFYANFHVSLHCLVLPRWCYYKHPKFPKWLWCLDIYYLSPFLNRLPGIHKYRYFIYRTAYKNALKKWPHLREEILSAADYKELLKGL